MEAGLSRLSRLVFVLPALALLLAVMPARFSAQETSFDLRWRVPKRVYLLYNSTKGEQAQAQAQRKVADKIDLLIGAPRGHVHLFGYELLTPDKREFGQGLLNDTCAPLTWEDILLQLAMFTTGKTEKQGDKYERRWSFGRCEGVLPFNAQSQYTVGAPVVYGKWETVAIASRHTLVDAQPPVDDTKRFHVWRELVIDCTAYFDCAQGLLRGARFSVRGVSFENPATEGSVKRFQFHDWELEWTFARLFDSTDEKDLRRFVDSAILRGRERLLALQDKENLWPSGAHKRGGTALSLLALLICGIQPDDPKISAGFAAMQPQEFGNIYEVALSLMAYEAKYISDDEKQSFLDGRKVESKRNVSPEDRKEMQRLLDWIVNNQNKTNPFWSYKYAEPAPGYGERFDLSVTQYSLLGMGSALRCGLTVPAGIIKNFVDKLREMQESDGPTVKRVIGGKPPKPGRPGKTETPDDREPKFTRAGKSVKARGWRYDGAAVYDPKTLSSNAYGSMTCSGLTCLMIALDIAAQMTPEQQKEEFGNASNYLSWQQSAAQSMESGMAWMEVHYTITRNSNFGRGWYYYFLYGFERVGVLCEARYLGEHDWYAEGASILICLQTPANDWAGNAVDTAFALLFLKRGTVPLKTPPPTGEK